MLLFPLTCFPRCRLCSSSQPQAFPAPLLWAQSTDERLTEAGAKGGAGRLRRCPQAAEDHLSWFRTVQALGK